MLVVVGTIIGVVVSEAVLRIQGDFRVGDERVVRLREHNPRSVRTFFGDSGGVEGRARKYRLETDADGFILPSGRHHQPDFSIVFLGGSTTECLHMSEDLRFPVLVGRIVEQETGMAVNSFNGGVVGSNSLHSLNILLNKVIPLGPDVVVLMHNINDLVILMHEGSYWNDSSTRATVETLGLYHVLRGVKNLLIPTLYERIRAFRGRAPDEFLRNRGRRIELDRRSIRDAYERNLTMFIDICSAQGITPVLMTQASRFTDEPDQLVAARTDILAVQHGVSYQEFRDLFRSLNESIRTVGRREGADVIDLAALVPPSREYIYGTVHLNRRGSELVAQLIADHLCGRLSRGVSLTPVRQHPRPSPRNGSGGA